MPISPRPDQGCTLRKSVDYSHISLVILGPHLQKSLRVTAKQITHVTNYAKKPYPAHKNPPEKGFGYPPQPF